jgi:tRNA(Ser,Leu) C12 N-acetylase TAN1
MAEANLLVTFDPTKIESAKKEIQERLSEIKESVKILKIEDGMAEISVKNAKKAVSDLKKIALKDKAKFSSTYNWIPADKWCKAKIADMQKVVKEIQEGISPKEKWKMEIGRHKTELHERDLIIKLTEIIDKPNVDLKDPEKIINVEIIKDKCAISLLKPMESLSIGKL